MKKSQIAAALALTSCLVIGAAAANMNSQPHNVTATFRPDMTLQFNGTPYTIRDTNGDVVSPLVYNGTTYLPLSSLGQMLGVQVSWDGATQTVIIGNQPASGGNQPSGSTFIGEAKAKEIALSHAGVASSAATFLQLHLDWENGRQVYDVEFWSGTTEYDYEIDAITGDVVSFDQDIENYTIPPAGNFIGEEKAKEIALNHAGVASSAATFSQVRLDWENGRQVYDVEFWSGTTEYDYEIDAATGDVVSFDQDIENYTIPPAPTQPSTGSYISRDQAAQLAQNRAPGAVLVKLEFDIDDGRAIYEGELRQGRTEYEFEIDAVTGEFLQWSQDLD